MTKTEFEHYYVYGGVSLTVYTHLCDLPRWVRQLPVCRLDFAIDLPNPIRDLNVTETEVRATLSFARVPYACIVPFAAIREWTAWKSAPVRNSIPKSTPAQRQAGRAGRPRRVLPAGWRVIEGGRGSGDPKSA